MQCKRAARHSAGNCGSPRYADYCGTALLTGRYEEAAFGVGAGAPGLESLVASFRESDSKCGNWRTQDGFDWLSASGHRSSATLANYGASHAWVRMPCVLPLRRPLLREAAHFAEDGALKILDDNQKYPQVAVNRREGQCGQTREAWAPLDSLIRSGKRLILLACIGIEVNARRIERDQRCPPVAMKGSDVRVRTAFKIHRPAGCHVASEESGNIGHSVCLSDMSHMVSRSQVRRITDGRTLAHFRGGRPGSGR